jgi:hypothetical protein
MSEMTPENTAMNTITTGTTTDNLTYNAGTLSNQFFTAEDIEKARREERDKLYGRITRSDERFRTLEEELKSLAADRDRRAAEEERHRQEAQAAVQAKEQEELSAKQLIEAKEKEWSERLELVRKEQEQQRVVYEKDQQYLQLKNYIERRAREETAADTIAPELMDFINGNTPEEVESSITLLREKTQRILNGIREGTMQTRAAMPGVSTAGQPPTGGPLDNTPGTKTMTPEDIAAIPPNEWHKYRAQLGLENAGSNRGMYG